MTFHIYIVDAVIFSTDEQQRVNDIDEVLKLLRQADETLIQPKCHVI